MVDESKCETCKEEYMNILEGEYPETIDDEIMLNLENGASSPCTYKNIHNDKPQERYVKLTSCRVVTGDAKPPPKKPWPSHLKKKTRAWYKTWYFNKRSGRSNRKKYWKYLRAYKKWKKSGASKAASHHIVPYEKE